MSWVPASWVEMRGLQRGIGQRISKERRRFEKLKPLTNEEAQALISAFLAEHGVTKGPSPEERREMWGMG